MNFDAYVNISYCMWFPSKVKKLYDHEQMCKILDVKPKSNWLVEHLLIWQTMGYMHQAYTYNKNFHLNKIPIEY
jgi:hypothetical protein